MDNEHKIRFADRTRWARFSFIPEIDDRPLTWNLLDSQEKFVARQVTVTLSRMILKGAKS